MPIAIGILLQKHRPHELMNRPSWWNKCI